MPFDPSLPAPNSPLESQVVRDQLQALFNLINQIGAVTAAQVDSVSTLPAGSPASVNVSVTGNTLHFTFELPQGQEGAPGQEGPQGIPGEVSQTDLSNGLQNTLMQTSANTNTVNIMPFGAPADYQPLVFQEVINKVNELINALRR